MEWLTKLSNAAALPWSTAILRLPHSTVPFKVSTGFLPQPPEMKDVFWMHIPLTENMEKNAVSWIICWRRNAGIFLCRVQAEKGNRFVVISEHFSPADTFLFPPAPISVSGCLGTPDILSQKKQAAWFHISYFGSFSNKPAILLYRGRFYMKLFPGYSSVHKFRMTFSW